MPARTLVLAVLALLLADPVAGYDLDQHRWRDRLLVLVAPDGADADLAAVRDELARRADAVRERDLLVLELLAEAGSVDGRALAPDAVARLRQDLALGVCPTEAGASAEPTPIPIDRAALSRRASRGEAPRESAALGLCAKAMLLIGKDGGIKARTALTTDLREIFLLIDAMPMRRDEMRAKRAGGKMRQGDAEGTGDE